MPQITFSNVTISHGSFNNDGGAVTRLIHVTANLSKAVRSAMNWQDLPDCADMAKLTGELTATNLVLTPNEEKLEKHQVECECTSATNFEIHRVQEKDGGSRRLELRFKLKIVEKAALSKIEAYCEKVGEAPASLKIGIAEQTELPLEGSQVVGEKKVKAATGVN